MSIIALMVMDLTNGPDCSEHIQQVHTEQAEGLGGTDEVGVVVNDAEPVGVAVGGESDVGGVVFERVHQGAEIVRYRFGLRPSPGMRGWSVLRISTMRVEPPDMRSWK